MTVSALSEISLTPIFDNSGSLVRNAKIYIYRPDTLDPLTVYKDQELSVPHTHPIVTAGSGRCPPIYVGEDPYRIRIFDNANQLIEDIPWLPGAVEAGGGDGGGGSDTAIATGDVVWRFSNGGVRAGWVRLNGNTIGNALSGASERANDDAHALFVWLWGQDTGLTLPVTPTRGASAESDWLANKQIALPDGRSAILGGTSTQGATAKNLFAGVPLVVGTVDKPGAFLGTAMHTLVAAQIPVHKHTLTDPGHTHAATQAAHTHGITDPGHAHSLYDPGHAHGVSDPGHAHTAGDYGHVHAIDVANHNHDYTRYQGQVTIFGGGGVTYTGIWQGTNSVNTASTDPAGSAGVGYASIYVNGAYTGIAIAAAGTGMSVYNAGTGISLGSIAPAITVPTVATGITMADVGGGEAHSNTQPTILGTFYMKL